MSDARPPSRPPPSKGRLPDDPAPSPPSRLPPSLAQSPEIGTAPSAEGRRRRWWLLGIVALVVIAALAVGAALLFSGNGDDRESRIEAQYDIVNREVAELRGAGVCTVRDALAQRLEGTPQRFDSDIEWEPVEVFDHVWSVKRLVEQLNEEWQLERGRTVPELMQFRDRWMVAWLALEAEGYRLDDESTATLVELSEDTLALTQSAGLDIC